MTEEHKAKMLAGKIAAKGKPRRHTPPIKAIRLKCLDCCNNQRTIVKFCTLDGIHSPPCPLWPFRFGKRPEIVARGPDARLVDPNQMPDATVPQEECQ